MERERERSTIEFPYEDLDAVVRLAEATAAAGDNVNADELATRAGHQKADTGAFRSKVGAAKMFGLLASERGAIRLTRLGRESLEPRTRAEARVEAFLNVELFKALYDEFQGKQLPDDSVLDERVRELGVSEKMVRHARRVFRRSARQAGFCQEDDDQLVRPRSSASHFEDGTNAGGSPPIDPLLRQVVDRLPGHRGHVHSGGTTYLDEVAVSSPRCGVPRVDRRTKSRFSVVKSKTRDHPTQVGLTQRGERDAA
ncbi:MAG: hypothetical protein U5R31_06665 [Acidimicrobiia bacterium]|nr:hypothetical protein [Acidimicrobiia bacterium]